jgi:hypothetical protein
MKSLPKTLYVKLEDPGDGEPFANASDDPADHAVLNGKVRVGVYELKYQTTVTAKVEVA